MGGEAGGGYAWLTRELFTATFRRAVLLARRLRYPKDQAEEVAQAAIVKSIDPDGSPWTPGQTPDFPSHVCNVLYSTHGNYIQSYEYLNVRSPITDAVLEKAGYGTPYEELEDAYAQKLAATRRDLLDQRVGGDALIVLLLEEGHEMSSTDRALAAGHSKNDIRLARERLKRHVLAVASELPARDATE